MREFRSSGSVRGALSNERPYRDFSRAKKTQNKSFQKDRGVFLESNLCKSVRNRVKSRLVV